MSVEKIIIFLDMDGVLNSQKMSLESDDFPDGNGPILSVEKDLVEKLRRWVESNGAKIVVSSSWRSNRMNAGGWKDPKTQNFNVWNALSWAGWEGVEDYLIGNTERLWGQSRGKEINDWLAKNENLNDDSTCVIILDDILNFTKKQKEENLVKTNPEFGLCDSDISKMDGMLKNTVCIKRKLRK